MDAIIIGWIVVERNQESPRGDEHSSIAVCPVTA
jgi:hypothetical protein